MVVGQIPHGIIIGLQIVRPRIWLPSMVLVWAFLTMVSAAVKTTAQLCVVRFFLGLAEASTYSGAIYIMGSWYKPQEISKRTAIFTASGQVGTMFAGVMMAAIYKGLGGLAGLGGWQWVFIIDGIITLPIALFGFFYFPDIPENTSARYLSDSEKNWILVLWSPICATLEAWVVQGNFILWLKYYAEHFTQSQINTYPLGVQAVGIVTNILAAWHMDATGTRIPMVVLVCIIQIVCAAMLLVPTLSFAGTMFAFYLSGSSYMVNPLIFGWASIILQRSGDEAVRSVTIYAMNIGATTLYTFWGIVFYAADESPYWKKGAIVMIVCSVVVLGFMALVIKVDKDSLAKYGSMIVDEFETAAATREIQALPNGDHSGSDDQKNASSPKGTSI
ncbi:pantothenate transporter liz1 [Colletotrichum spaethianum]|uniref:Pantothenate transporter liz1 n=1 Tax=Colletotrichum spaethianum TaxID=700344 RepID=A0AA37LBX3_9PEZI|nr:pantothenate transporter liz1 [Colletotrichum spaethianum]GKT44499.1 pantothenate transporter liz1 [Colletotrichum spaethianum]